MALTAIRYQVYEILDKVTNTKSRQDKVSILKEYQNNALKDVLRGTFDNVIQWNLPAGSVPYNPTSEESPPTSLLRQHMNFKYFVKGLLASEQLTRVRREKMFLDMCESIHPRDADLIIGMINKKMPVKGITKKLVMEAFPELLHE
tara:strand:+ start:52 stop:489 length:438 start_codon:yes stop_codon:yes gene_type:complete